LEFVQMMTLPKKSQRFSQPLPPPDNDRVTAIDSQQLEAACLLLLQRTGCSFDGIIVILICD